MTSGGWMVPEENCDELVFQYHGTFNYWDFCEVMIPVMAEYIMTPENADGSVGTYMIPAGDHDVEFMNMFDKMGLGELDGQSGFTFTRKLGHVEIPMVHSYRGSSSKVVVVAEVAAVLVIEPDVPDGTETAIH